MKLRNILLSIVASSVMVLANSGDSIQMSSATFEEVVTMKDGKKATELKALDKAIPGMVVTYVNTIKNPTNETATNLVIVNPVPEHTTFVPNDIETKGATMEYSVDGKVFSEPSKVFINDSGVKRVAEPTEYTHVRWTIAKLEANAEMKIKLKTKIK
ncbi:MAG: hypothetical protein K0U38_04115 [Epsilonproteobacteria bacterium]|nr:hypothetical protein [Campylobacterota bacterium]